MPESTWISSNLSCAFPPSAGNGVRRQWFRRCDGQFTDATSGRGAKERARQRAPPARGSSLLQRLCRLQMLLQRRQRLLGKIGDRRRIAAGGLLLELVDRLLVVLDHVGEEVLVEA